MVPRCYQEPRPKSPATFENIRFFLKKTKVRFWGGRRKQDGSEKRKEQQVEVGLSRIVQGSVPWWSATWLRMRRRRSSWRRWQPRTRRGWMACGAGAAAVGEWSAGVGCCEMPRRGGRFGESSARAVENFQLRVECANSLQRGNWVRWRGVRHHGRGKKLEVSAALWATSPKI